MARNFRKIIAWQKADDLVVKVYRTTTKFFPSDERYGLTSQVRRAAVSVASNIAEGSGRMTLKDFRRFLFNAQGSLLEVEYQLHLAHRLNVSFQYSGAFARCSRDFLTALAIELTNLTFNRR